MQTLATGDGVSATRTADRQRDRHDDGGDQDNDSRLIALTVVAATSTFLLLAVGTFSACLLWRMRRKSGSGSGPKQPTPEVASSEGKRTSECGSALSSLH
jgi:hypothetical protein